MDGKTLSANLLAVDSCGNMRVAKGCFTYGTRVCAIHAQPLAVGTSLVFASQGMSVLAIPTNSHPFTIRAKAVLTKASGFLRKALVAILVVMINLAETSLASTGFGLESAHASPGELQKFGYVALDGLGMGLGHSTGFQHANDLLAPVVNRQATRGDCC